MNKEEPDISAITIDPNDRIVQNSIPHSRSNDNSASQYRIPNHGGARGGMLCCELTFFNLIVVKYVSSYVWYS